MKISFVFNTREIEKKPPQLYIPSYVYHGAMTPMPAPPVTKTQSTEQQTKMTQAEPTKQQHTPQVKNQMGTLPLPQKSILAMSRNLIQQNQVNTAINRMNEQEPPILLVGDRHSIVDPLIKLMGRALSAHFSYPKMEGSFGVRGTVYVELVLHPEGFFSDVQIVKSSDNQDFDTAALYAVNQAPTVVGADKFLPKAKRFVVGFIFD